MTYWIFFACISFWECLEWICMQELQVSGPKWKCKVMSFSFTQWLSSLPWTEKRVYYNFFLLDKDVFTYSICMKSQVKHISPLKLKAKDNRRKNLIMKGMKPYVVVFVIQTIYAIMFLLSKAAFDHGINNFIFVFYRQAVATIFLIPFVFIFEWYVCGLWN